MDGSHRTTFFFFWCMNRPYPHLPLFRFVLLVLSSNPQSEWKPGYAIGKHVWLEFLQNLPAREWFLLAMSYDSLEYLSLTLSLPRVVKQLSQILKKREWDVHRHFANLWHHLGIHKSDWKYRLGVFQMLCTWSLKIWEGLMLLPLSDLEVLWRHNMSCFYSVGHRWYAPKYCLSLEIRTVFVSQYLETLCLVVRLNKFIEQKGQCLKHNKE